MTALKGIESELPELVADVLEEVAEVVGIEEIVCPLESSAGVAEAFAMRTVV